MDRKKYTKQKKQGEVALGTCQPVAGEWLFLPTSPNAVAGHIRKAAVNQVHTALLEITASWL